MLEEGQLDHEEGIGEEIEVDTEEKKEGDGTEKETAPEGQQETEGADDGEDKPKKRKGRKANEAIREAKEQRAAAEEYAFKLHQENERLKAEKAQLTENNLSQYETSAKEQLERAKLDLKTAHEAGDSDGIVAAQLALSRANYILNRVEEHKFLNNNNDKPKADQEEPAPQRPQQVANPVRDKWLQANPWFDSNSADFDEEMADDIKIYATQLNSQLKASGRAAEIGTKAYFKTIDDYKKRTWDEEEAGASSAGGLPPNSPPSRDIPGNRGKQSSTIKLSPQQVEAAKMMNLTDPRTGRRLSDEEHLKAYAKALKTQPSVQQQNPR